MENITLASKSDFLLEQSLREMGEGVNPWLDGVLLLCQHW